MLVNALKSTYSDATKKLGMFADEFSRIRLASGGPPPPYPALSPRSSGTERTLRPFRRVPIPLCDAIPPPPRGACSRPFPGTVGSAFHRLDSSIASLWVPFFLFPKAQGRFQSTVVPNCLSNIVIESTSRAGFAAVRCRRSRILHISGCRRNPPPPYTL